MQKLNRGQSCRNCKHLSVGPNKAGKIVPRSTHMYPCLAPCLAIDELPIPDCAKHELLFARWRADDRILRRRSMNPDDGTECVSWEKR